VKRFSWNSEKDRWLKRERGVGFQEVVFQISQGEILDIIENPNQRKYPQQKAFVLEIRDYIYFVPFVESDEEVFLKTIIPSRKLIKEYRGDETDER
jgi:hypothetical protein